MLDPANELLALPTSPTISSVSSSDLDTESTGSFFHDRSTSLGSLMGVTFPVITFTAPAQRHEATTVSVGSSGNVVGGRRTNMKAKKKNKAAALMIEQRRKRRWWRLCIGEDLKPSSLGEFLEVERRFGGEAFFDTAVELEGAVNTHPRNGRLLFADGRVLPPPSDVDDGTSTVGSLCRCPLLLTGMCSGGVD